MTYDPKTRRAFVVNAHAGAIDVLDLTDPKNIKKINSISVKPYGKSVNSAAFKNGLLAAAVEADPKQDPGLVVFFDAEGAYINRVRVGPQPDMVCFTPDGRYVLTANEGEPDHGYRNDPEGSVTIIDLSAGPAKARSGTADFKAFDKETLVKKGVRVSHPRATAAMDLEPEYIAVSPDGRTAYVILQENNALAVVDIPGARVVDLLPLGLKNWKDRGLSLDASDKDKKINLKPWPVFGCYMPDAAAAMTVGGHTYILTANEGDSREYDNYEDEIRLNKAELDPGVFPAGRDLQNKKKLGRLKIIKDLSDTDNDQKVDRIVAFGGRSFSIWDEEGNQVFDSGDDFEKILAEKAPEMFNAANDKNKFDDRSDDKGPEPEGVVIGAIGEKQYAFIGLERVGGIMVYDVTDPLRPKFIDYANNRIWTGDPEKGTAGDLAPEGLCFVPARDSPNGKDLLIVANEVSGTTTVYEVLSGKN